MKVIMLIVIVNHAWLPVIGLVDDKYWPVYSFACQWLYMNALYCFQGFVEIIKCLTDILMPYICMSIPVLLMMLPIVGVRQPPTLRQNPFYRVKFQTAFISSETDFSEYFFWVYLHCQMSLSVTLCVISRRGSKYSSIIAWLMFIVFIKL